MYLNLFGTFAILCVSCFCGLIAYAYYYDCDPLLNGRIKKYDQILPLLVIDLLRNIPGLSGLFIASIYAACLRYYIFMILFYYLKKNMRKKWV